MHARYQRNVKDTVFQTDLRQLDKENPGEQEKQDAPQGGKPPGTPLKQEERERLTAYYNAWNTISARNGWGTMPEE